MGDMDTHTRSRWRREGHPVGFTACSELAIKMTGVAPEPMQGRMTDPREPDDCQATLALPWMTQIGAADDAGQPIQRRKVNTWFDVLCRTVPRHNLLSVG